MVSWPRCFGPEGRQHIMAGSVERVEATVYFMAPEAEAARERRVPRMPFKGTLMVTQLLSVRPTF